MKRWCTIFILIWLMPGTMAAAAENEVQLELPAGSRYQLEAQEMGLAHDIIGIYLLEGGSCSQIRVNGIPLEQGIGMSLEKNTEIVLEPMADGEYVDCFKVLYIYKNRIPCKISYQIRYAMKATEKPEAMDATYVAKEGVGLNGILQGKSEYGKVEFMITRKPKKGTLVHMDGSFTYHPFDEASGTDSFLFCVKDKLGNLSDVARVKLCIEDASIYYDDMEPDGDHRNAILLYEYGILRGTQMGEQLYFEPERLVSENDFMMMLESVEYQTGKVELINHMDMIDRPITRRVAARVLSRALEGQQGSLLYAMYD